MVDKSYQCSGFGCQVELEYWNNGGELWNIAPSQHSIIPFAPDS
jgi:hypothetical protein